MTKETTAPAEDEAVVADDPLDAILDDALGPEDGDEAPKATAEPEDAGDAGGEGEDAAPEGEAAEAAPEAPAKPVVDAPPGMNAAAQKAWAEVPPEVQYEVSRRYGELEAGLQKYQQAFEPLKPYQAMAEQAGTTLEDGLREYVRIQELVKSDPKQLMQELQRISGIDPASLAPRQPQNQTEAALFQMQQQNHALMQEINSLKGQFGQVQARNQAADLEAQSRQHVAEFAAAHDRFEELAPQISDLITKGVADLPTAYEIADRMVPPGQQDAPPTAAQTRANLSVGGAPGSGSNPPSRTPPVGRDALDQIFDEIGI